MTVEPRLQVFAIYFYKYFVFLFLQLEKVGMHCPCSCVSVAEPQFSVKEGLAVSPSVLLHLLPLVYSITHADKTLVSIFL